MVGRRRGSAPGEAFQRRQLAFAAQNGAHREEVGGARDVVDAQDRGARVDPEAERRQRPRIALRGRAAGDRADEVLA